MTSPTRTMGALKLACLTATVLLAMAAAIAHAEPEPVYQRASYTLTAQQPGASTGEKFLIDYTNPSDSDAKPVPVRKLVTVLPRGAHFDTSVPDSCAASDSELVLLGGAACPDGSLIGGGVVTVDTGLPTAARTTTVDVQLFNNLSHNIYVNTVRGSGVRTVIRAETGGRRTVTPIGRLAGTPPDGGALDTVDIDIYAISRAQGTRLGHYITAPPRCPPREEWTTELQFTYEDGTAQSVRTQTPCERSRAGRTRAR